MKKLTNEEKAKYGEAYEKILFRDITFSTLDIEHQEFLKLFIGYNLNKNLLVNKRAIYFIEEYLKERAGIRLYDQARGYLYAKRYEKDGNRFPDPASAARLLDYFRLLTYAEAIKYNYGLDYLLKDPLFKNS